MMKLKNLIVTQESLRNVAQICAMIDYVREGGLFTESALEQFAREQGMGRVSPLMQVSQFEDGANYLHDGHHRVLSIFLGGRDYLHQNEYKITEWTYQDYLDVVFLHKAGTLESLPWMGWVTPHDVKTQVRLPDFKAYKEVVKGLYYAQGEEAALKYIHDNTHQYAKPRELTTIEDFAKALPVNCGVPNA